MENKAALPPNWTVESIGDLGRVVTGKTPSTEDPGNFGGTIPFITPSDMDGRKRLSRTARFLTGRGAASVSSAKIPAGTVMVSCIGSDMGKASIAGCDAVTNQQINSIIVKDVVSADYVYYNLSARQTEIKHLGSGGSAVPILNKGHFSQLLIPLPPLAEQKAIAHILGTLDDKIEVNRRMNETLEGMARALFKSWFVDFDPVLDNALAAGNPIPEEYRDRAAQRADAATSAASQGRPFGLPNPLAAQFPNAFHDSDLGPIPQGWEVKALSECIDLIGGGTPKTSIDEYWGGDIPWFSVVDAPADSDVFVIHTEKQITQSGLQNSSAKLLPQGTTIISARGTVGKCALMGVPMTTNQSCYAIRGLHNFTDAFVYFTIRWNVADLQRQGHGSVFNTITRSTFDGIPIPAPARKEPDCFERTTEPLLHRILTNLFESETLSALRDTLLPKLLSGELRVNDAEKFVEAAV